jgi:hypothetical protein
MGHALHSRAESRIQLKLLRMFGPFIRKELATTNRALFMAKKINLALRMKLKDRLADFQFRIDSPERQRIGKIIIP